MSVLKIKLNYLPLIGPYLVSLRPSPTQLPSSSVEDWLREKKIKKLIERRKPDIELMILLLFEDKKIK